MFAERTYSVEDLLHDGGDGLRAVLPSADECRLVDRSLENVLTKQGWHLDQMTLEVSKMMTWLGNVDLLQPFTTVFVVLRLEENLW